MSIFLDRNSKVIVQGMTGSEGRKHTRRMLGAGTNVVGGVNPRKAGASVEFDVAPIGPGAQERRAGAVSVPVFGSVAEAKEATGANVSVVFVPPAHTLGAVIEAVDAGLDLVVVITEGVPVKDATEFYAYAAERGVRLIGPNCPGIISPGQSNVGITPPDITGPGRVGLVSKSGTLTYQLMYELADLGFTTCIGIGGDPVIGTTHIDAIKAFEADPDTELIVMIGEIGGDAEERAAAYIARGKDDGACGGHRLRLVRNGRGQEGSLGGRRRARGQDAQSNRCDCPRNPGGLRSPRRGGAGASGAVGSARGAP